MWCLAALTSTDSMTTMTVSVCLFLVIFSTNSLFRIKLLLLQQQQQQMATSINHHWSTKGLETHRSQAFEVFLLSCFFIYYTNDYITIYYALTKKNCNKHLSTFQGSKEEGGRRKQNRAQMTLMPDMSFVPR